MNIGENMKKYRKEKKLTQPELGALIGKSESSIRKYESGSVVPDIDTLSKIAETLNVSINDLLGTSGTSFATPNIIIDLIESEKKKAAIKKTNDKFNLKDILENINLTDKVDSKEFSEYIYNIKNPSRFLLKNAFWLDTSTLTDEQIAEIMDAINFTIKLKLEEFKSKEEK